MLEVISKRKLKLCFGDFILIALLQIPAFLAVVEKEFFFSFIQKHLWIFFLIPFVWVLVLFVARAYEVIEETRDKISDTNIFVKAALISIITLGFIFYLLASLIDFPQRILLIHSLLVIIALWFWRIAFSKLIHQPKALKKVLILGIDQPAQEMAQEIIARPNRGYQLIGFIEDRKGRTNNHKLKYGYSGGEIDKQFILGTEGEILQIINKCQIDLVVSAIAEEKSRRIVQSILEIQQRGIPVMEMPDFYGELTGQLPIQYFGSSWIILGQFEKKSETRRALEYFLNFIFASCFLIPALPLMGIIAVLIKLEDKGPVFYQQKRIGKNGKVFFSIKFRTMKPEAEKETGPIWAQKDDERITKTGRFLRKYRLDEIPQLINILLGQMVFVGPRPERPEFVEYLEKKIPFYPIRHLVKPGLTGWAQVRGKYGASVQDALQKLQYELYYIKHHSLFFDLIIILKTIEVVLTGRGAR